LEVRSLIARLSDGPINPWPEDLSVYVLAGTLSGYLKEQAKRDYLIPGELYEPIIAAMCISDVSMQIRLLKRIITLLPPIRVKMLAYLCQYWHGLADKQSMNSMTADSLGVCLSQALLIAPTGLSLAEARQQVTIAGQAVSVLISNCDDIFEDVKVTVDDFCSAEDLEVLRAPKLNMANVNHLIVRDTFRRGSRIPWLPLCQVEVRPVYQRPAEKPVKPEQTQAPARRRLTIVLKKIMKHARLRIAEEVDLESEVANRMESMAAEPLPPVGDELEVPEAGDALAPDPQAEQESQERRDVPESLVPAEQESQARPDVPR
jgi:hypothetical protein